MGQIDILPIKWFGDRKAYEQSHLRIITVGLNPSDKEFREKDTDAFDSKLRFPAFDGSNESLIESLNAYFEENPYNWFQSFEHILKGMGASYYAKNDLPNRALHTDICSPWATDPTWTNLSKEIKIDMVAAGFQEWKALVDELKPHIVLISVAQEYVDMLGINDTISEFVLFDKDKNGNNRKKPVVIRRGWYGDALVIMGRTWNKPFGALGVQQKNYLGTLISDSYDK